MMFANIFRLKFSAFMLSITPLHYSRWKHMEKYCEGEKTSDEVMNRMWLYTSIYNIV